MQAKHQGDLLTLLQGDCVDVLKKLTDESVHCCVTSPPYWGLRDYGHDGQIGLEQTPEEYVAKMVEVFREVRRVLRKDGTLWLNLGDSYAANGRSGLNEGWAERAKEYAGGGHKAEPSRLRKEKRVPDGLKHKDLVGIPWRVAFALQSDGWYLRQDIIWHKPNPMPESVKDRCTKAHEYIFLLSKSDRYYYDIEATKETASTGKNKTGRGKYHLDGNMKARALALAAASRVRNRRSVWTVATRPYRGAHFATFPPKLIEPCVLAGCPVGGTVLDPFNGAGTTGLVSLGLGRRYLGIELNPEYIDLTKQRLATVQPVLQFPI